MILKRFSFKAQLWYGRKADLLHTLLMREDYCFQSRCRSIPFSFVSSVLFPFSFISIYSFPFFLAVSAQFFHTSPSLSQLLPFPFSFSFLAFPFLSFSFLSSLVMQRDVSCHLHFLLTGDHHGCPYKYLDKSSLKAELLRKGLAGNEANEVMRLSTEGHYQVNFPLSFSSLFSSF